MQALKFILDNWQTLGVVGTLIAAKLHLTKKRTTKEQNAKLRADAIQFIAEKAAQGVAALLKQKAVKHSSAIQVWEVRVRELAETALVLLGGAKLDDAEWLKAREVASDFFEQVTIYAVEDFTKAYQTFYASWNAHARMLERSDAALIRASEETAARREAETRVSDGGGP